MRESKRYLLPRLIWIKIEVMIEKREDLLIRVVHFISWMIAGEVFRMICWIGCFQRTFRNTIYLHFGTNFQRRIKQVEIHT